MRITKRWNWFQQNCKAIFIVDVSFLFLFPMNNIRLNVLSTTIRGMITNILVYMKADESHSVSFCCYCWLNLTTADSSSAEIKIDHHVKFQKRLLYSKSQGVYVKDLLIIYSFTSHSRIFHLNRDVTITGEGHHYRWRAVNLGLCSALRAFGQGGILRKRSPAVKVNCGEQDKDRYVFISKRLKIFESFNIVTELNFSHVTRNEDLFLQQS
jgi:hypothetical protein